MDITKTVAYLRYKYHMIALDLNNILYQLGLKSDEKAEECAKYHVMIVITDCLPRMGYDISKIFKKES